jgi:magnesium transporter
VVPPAANTSGAMAAHLVACERGTAYTGADVPGAARRLLAAGDAFWLDLHAPAPDELALLRDPFRFHPLSVEDSEHFGQRPKLEGYEDHAFLVLFGAVAEEPDEDWLVEVHCFVRQHQLVTVHRDRAPALEALARRLGAQGAPGRGAVLLHRVADALVDGFAPALDAIDRDVDAIEDDAVTRTTARVAAPADMQRVVRVRRRLTAFRRFVAPERDLFDALAAGAVTVPGLAAEDLPYLRDVYDHLVRLVESVDLHREELASATDVYLSAAGNRLNEVIRQLTIISTVFLPLTFVTGFFGQNFGWLVDNIDTLGDFVVLGLGLELAAAVALGVLFRRRGWI